MTLYHCIDNEHPGRAQTMQSGRLHRAKSTAQTSFRSFSVRTIPASPSLLLLELVTLLLAVTVLLPLINLR